MSYTIEMSEENVNHCKGIVETIEQYANGCFFKYNDSLYPIDPDDEYWTNNTDGNSYYLDDDGYYYYEIDGEKVEESDVEPLSIYDYFRQEKEVEVLYMVREDGSYYAVRLQLEYGGPATFINTLNNKLELYWWNEYAEYHIDNDIISQIDQYWEEMYEMSRY